VCGALSQTSRCALHPRRSRIGANNAIHTDPRWTRMAKRAVARHVGAFGYECPGYHRPAHPASDLTADHVVPLAAGGAPFDWGNVAVLCRSCNATKGEARV
jgi:5-methylcytosine-specific restriction protein A